MPTVTLSRAKQRFGANQAVTLTVGDQEIKLKNGGQDQIKLPVGQHPVHVKSNFGKVSGTIIAPAHKEVEVGFNVTDRSMNIRLILVISLVILSLVLLYFFDIKWAFVFILIGTLPSIITNRKALYVDVIGDEITEEILEKYRITEEGSEES